jgi:hypothetical protein
MALKPEMGVLGGVAVAALVYGIYQVNLPTTAAVRASSPNNQHVAGARKVSTWEAAAVVAGVSLIAKDPTIFVIGGAILVMLDFSHRYANAVSNVTGQVAGSVSSTGVSASAGVTG